MEVNPNIGASNELQTFFARSTELFAKVRPNGNFEILTQFWRTRLFPKEFSSDQLAQSQFVHPDDLQVLEMCVRLTFSGVESEPCEIRVCDTQGNAYWLRLEVFPAEDRSCLFAIGKDITEKKRVASRLFQIEKSAHIGGWEIDVITNKVSWSTECYKIHEADPSRLEVDLKTMLGFYPESSKVVESRINQALESGEGFDLRVKFRTMQGKDRWARIFAKTESRDGRVLRCFGAIQDITEEVNRQEQSNKHIERFQAIANNIPVILALFDERGQFVWCNPSWVTELGWDFESMAGRDMMSEFYPDETYRKEVLEFMLSAIPGWREFYTRRRDGEFIYTKWANVLLSDGFSVGIGLNVDQAHRLTEKVKKAHDKLQLAMQVGNFGTWEYYPKISRVDFSEDWGAILGIEPQKLGKSLSVFIEAIHPDERGRVELELLLCLSGKKVDFNTVCRVRHSDETWLSIQTFGRVVERDSSGAPEKFLAVAVDVTQSKVAESLLIEQNQMLEKMRERLDLAKTAGKFGVWDWDLKDDVLVWDGMMYEMFEIEALQFNNRFATFLELLVKEDQVRLRDELDLCFRKKQKEFRSEFRFTSKNGTTKVIATLATCVYDDAGAIQRLIGTNWDITNQRESEAALVEARIEAERFFNISLDPLCVVGFEGNFRRVNPAFIKALGYSEMELSTLKPLEIVHPDDLAATKDYLLRLSQGQTPLGFEHRVRARDGGYRILNWTAKPDFETKVIFGAFRDLTVVRESEIKLMQSARMASLGEMAGGIAHEVNNPLAIIQGRAQQLLRSFERGNFEIEKVKKDLTTIDNTVSRIAKIVRGLRSFSRDSAGDPFSRESVSEIAKDVLDLARERFKNHNIELKLDISEELFINCRPQQIGQVLLNLVNNSHDAVIQLSSKWVRIDVRKSEDRVCIQVVDSGGGIAPEVAAKIMNPFFTTKEVGKGTGLGLSISRGIAQDHGGRLYYDSAAAHTTFVFELPIYSENKSAGRAS